jgi:FkbM family methyltransferase
VVDDYPETQRLAPLDRAKALLRTAGATSSPARFVAREVASRRPGNDAAASPPRRYRLRHFAGDVGLRHGTLDVPLFFDIMVRRGYQAPPAVLDAERGSAGVSVVDLGANIGLFAAYLSSVVPITSLVGYEPDRANAALLRENLAGSPAVRDWRIVEACAGVADGEVSFLEGQFQESRVVENGEEGSRRLPVVDALPDMLEADWIKIDIEGSEWDLLADPRFADIRARVVVLEYHAWMCPGPDPRRMAIDALTGAGFRVWEKGEHIPGYGELWALRR